MTSALLQRLRQRLAAPLAENVPQREANWRALDRDLDNTMADLPVLACMACRARMARIACRGRMSRKVCWTCRVRRACRASNF